MTSMKPSEQIKRIIRQSPLTPYRLAKLAGIGESVLSLFLSGKRTITLETLDALADVLGLTVSSDGRDVQLAKDAPKAGRPKNESRKPRKAKTTRQDAAPVER